MKTKLLPYFFILLFSYSLLEAGTCLLMKKDYLKGELPTFSFDRVATSFWKDIHPAFGVWHEANSTYRHYRSCFDVKYHANALGMRDKPREIKSSESRVVVIGDSFVEGWGVEEDERFTNLLEADKGREFLNFGTSGSFGPTQYFLLYENFAKEFSHDEVLVTILPANDFDDDDFEVWKNEERHRPFWTGSPPDGGLRYTVGSPEGFSTRRWAEAFFREFSYFYNAAERIAFGFGIFRRTQGASRFYEFSEAEFERMVYSLQRLRASAGDKKMTLVLIPMLSDLQSYDREGESPLAKRLAAWSQDQNLRFIDLSADFHDRRQDWEAYYFPCDAHWSATGHRAAFEALKDLF